jgi:hypothetical protein
MDRLREFQYTVEHQHADGSWGAMVEDRSHHDAAAHDPERDWIRRVFRCTSCEEVVALTSGERTAAPDAE